MCTPTGQSIQYGSIRGRTFGLVSARDWPRSSPQPEAGTELRQFSLLGMVAPIIKCPFGVTGAYIAGTSLAACIWPMTHEAGMTTFFEVRSQANFESTKARFKVTIHTGGNYLIREALFPRFCNYIHPLNLTTNLTDTRHSLHFKRGQDDLLRGGYQPPDSGQTKDILSSFTKCQLACHDNAYICIPPSFAKFVKVLLVHHLHHFPDYLSTYLYWNLICKLIIWDNQHQNHPLILRETVGSTN